MPERDAKVKPVEIVLVLSPEKKYRSTTLNYIKSLIVQEGFLCIYLSATWPYPALMKFFEEENVPAEYFFVIDVTPGGTPATSDANVLSIASPSALTDMSLATATALQSLPKGKRALVLDSVSTLLMYNSAGSVTKFAYYLTNKSRELGASTVFLWGNDEMDKKVKTELVKMCDRTVYL